MTKSYNICVYKFQGVFYGPESVVLEYGACEPEKDVQSVAFEWSVYCCPLLMMLSSSTLSLRFFEHWFCSFLTKDCEGLQLNQVTLAGLSAFPVHGWSSVADHLHTVFILCVLSEGMTSYLFSSCNFYCCEDCFVCLFLTICVLFWLVLGWHILLHNFTFYLFLLIFRESTYRQK